MGRSSLRVCAAILLTLAAFISPHSVADVSYRVAADLPKEYFARTYVTEINNATALNLHLIQESPFRSHNFTRWTDFAAAPLHEIVGVADLRLTARSGEEKVVFENLSAEVDGVYTGLIRVDVPATNLTDFKLDFDFELADGGSISSSDVEFAWEILPPRRAISPIDDELGAEYEQLGTTYSGYFSTANEEPDGCAAGSASNSGRLESWAGGTATCISGNHAASIKSANSRPVVYPHLSYMMRTQLNGNWLVKTDTVWPAHAEAHAEIVVNGYSQSGHPYGFWIFPIADCSGNNCEQGSTGVINWDVFFPAEAGIRYGAELTVNTRASGYSCDDCILGGVASSSGRVKIDHIAYMALLQTTTWAHRYRADDGTAERQLDMNQDDDLASRTFYVDALDLEGSTGALLWVYAYKDQCAGTTGLPFTLKVNGVLGRSFNPCTIWPTGSGKVWKSISFSPSILTGNAYNTFEINDSSAHTVTNLYVGLDDSSTADSIARMEWERIYSGPMMYVELHKSG